MKKIKSFTIVELLVAMALSAVVIGTGYTSFTIVSRLFSNYRSTNNTVAQAIQLDMLLKNDFSDSQYILKGENGITFLKEDSTSVNYYFGDAFIVRAVPNLTDTFFFSHVINETLFEKEKSEQAGILVDEINIRTVVNKEDLVFNYKKSYGADVLIKKLAVSSGQ